MSSPFQQQFSAKSPLNTDEVDLGIENQKAYGA